MLKRKMLLALLAIPACQAHPGVAVGKSEAALYAEDCEKGAGHDGRVGICHATSSDSNDYVHIRVSTDACINAHAQHPRDVQSDDESCTPWADLSLRGSLVPQSYFSGPVFPGPVSYEVAVFNNGPFVARNVTLTQSLPGDAPEAKVDASDLGGDCSIEGAVITCLIAEVPVGAELRARVTFSLPGPNWLSVNLNVIADNPDPYPDDNDSYIVFSATPQSADTRIEILGSFPNILALSGPYQQTYRFTVYNNGPTTANGVLTVSFPDNAIDPHFEYLRPGPAPFASECTQLGRTFTCPFSNLDPWRSIYEWWFTAGMPEELGAVVSVTASVAASGDPDPTNNTFVAETTIVPYSADLVLTATGGADFVAEGDRLIYDLRAINDGPSTALGMQLTDTLPEGSVVESVYATFTGVVVPCGITANVVTCVWPYDVVPWSQYPGAELTVHIEAVAAGGDPARLTNTASVTSETLDADPANNSVTLTSERIAASADLALAMFGYASIPPGSIAYRLHVESLGPTAAHDVLLSDPLPSGAVPYFVGASAVDNVQPSCSWSGSLITCDFGDLRPGTSSDVDIVAHYPAQTGSVVNTASLTSSTPDPEPGNESATATFQIGAD